MTSGLRAMTAAGSTMRSFPRRLSRSSGRTLLAQQVREREDRLPARCFDEFFHPRDTRDQRVVPFLEEHARAHRQRARGVANGVEIRGKPRRERRSLLRAADERPHDPDHLQDFSDRPLIERVDRIAAADQLARDVRLQIGEAEDQIRPERLDLVEPRVDERRPSASAAPRPGAPCTPTRRRRDLLRRAGTAFPSFPRSGRRCAKGMGSRRNENYTEA